MSKNLYDPSVTLSDKNFLEARAVVEGHWKKTGFQYSQRTLNLCAFEVAQQAQFMERTRNEGKTKSVFEGIEHWAPTVDSLTENVVGSDIATFTQQIIMTIVQLYEKLQIEQLVTFRNMNGPTAYLQTQTAEYADAGAFYEAGTEISGNLDPDYSNSPGECVVSRKIDFSNSLRSVTAVTKRLSAKYSEIARLDAESQFGIDLPSKLAGLISTQLSREIQQQHIEEMIANAGLSASWNATPTGLYSGLDPAVYAATLWSGAWRNLDVQARQAIDVRRGFNRLAGSPVEVNRLISLDTFRATQDTGFNKPADMQGNGGVTRFNNVQGSSRDGMPLLEFDFMPANTLLGVVKDDERPSQLHMPYQAIRGLGTFLDPETACYTIGTMTRYATDTPIANGLGVITITPEP